MTLGEIANFTPMLSASKLTTPKRTKQLGEIANRYKKMMLTNDTLQLTDFDELIELSLAVDFQLDEMMKWRIATEDEAMSFYRLNQVKLKLDEMVLFERIARDKAKQTTE